MTSLAAQYDRQRQWRDFDTVYDCLGSLDGLWVADAGCGSGTVSDDLAARGAEVLGLDTDDTLRAHASRRVPAARFRNASIDRPGSWGGGPFDLIWCSFAIAYLGEPIPALRAWRSVLAPRGRVVLIEIADLFAHMPLCQGDREALAMFERRARKDGTYRFDAGHHLASWVTEAGYEVIDDFDLRDAELCAQGVCSESVRLAWSDRLARMPRLLGALGPGFKDRFVACLESPDHVSKTRVRCVVARNIQAI